jgi:hypothetical protein
MGTYEELNKQWKATCKIVLGEEIGELADYRKWLLDLNDPRFVKKSSVSGKEVVLTSGAFHDQTAFIGMDEVDFNKKIEPLTIDEIKDVDSILEAVGERVHYCGNIVLGNSQFVEKSSNITDSHFVYDSVKIDASKNIAYSQYLRLCENVFGTNEGGEGKFCIRSSILFKNKRCFEIWNSPVCSDCHYSCGLENCNDALFSFNAIGKNYLIGNRELPRDKYLTIKKKLLGEIVERLKRDKAAPSLMEIVGRGKLDYGEATAALETNVTNEQIWNKNVVEASFSKTSALFFGKPLASLDNYQNWLSRDVITPAAIPSAISKRKVPMSKWPGLSQMPVNRVVTCDEAKVLGEKLKLTESEASRLSLATASDLIGKIAYFTPEHFVGENKNLSECQWGFNAMNCYRSVICVNSRDCAYTSWPRSSQYLFGCGIVFDSEFSMKCYDSVKLTRCFEVDGGRGCTDTWFSHNVEGLQNALFCFNTKSKRYAVGNAEVGPEQFGKTKRLLQEWMYDELSAKKKLDLSIYELGKKE